MTPYDYGVLVFYFAFMVAIGWVFRRFVTDVSDYFRGGGKALWWMVGGSAFMVQFSAWTFTGAASMVYSDGWPVLTIYLGNALGFLAGGLYFAPRMRQLRVITGVEAVRDRFGRTNEQFFTWLQIPFGLLQAGIWLNALSVFFAAVFGADLTMTIVLTGIVTVLIALLGGSWAVLASDFTQVLVLMPVTIAVAILAIAKLGGLGEFLHQVPNGFVHPAQLYSRKFLLLWCLAMLLKQLHTTNNLADANRYLCAKDSGHARKASYFGSALFLVGAMAWFVPPMIAALRFPQLQAIFPGLRNPAEGAYIAVARDVMPVGMMGLLVSGIFAATMSSMDAGLNRNSGFFVKNFYQPILRPDATDRHLLRAGKATTLVLGGLVIVVALRMNELQDLSLFVWMQRIAILIGIPILVPLFLGLFVRNTPPWSAWSTVVVGFISSILIMHRLTPQWAAVYFDTGDALDLASGEYWTEAIAMLGNFIVCSVWFLATKFFWFSASPEDRQRVETFFVRLNQPVDFGREQGAQTANDGRQYSVIGMLALIYGGFICLLALIPNPLVGRMAFLGCGAVMAGIGGWLKWLARNKA
jgi:solute:Na+ symporter, SSS family